MKRSLTCSHCGANVTAYRNPFPTVDLIIRSSDEKHGEGIVLIRRRNPPPGWALPGGFVDYGESLEEAAVREAREETGLDVTGLRQFHAYSDPQRDPRHHSISVVFLAQSVGIPQAGDDARECEVFPLESLPEPLAFDHRRILEEYRRYRCSGRYPR